VDFWLQPLAMNKQSVAKDKAGTSDECFIVFREYLFEGCLSKTCDPIFMMFSSRREPGYRPARSNGLLGSVLQAKKSILSPYSTLTIVQCLSEGRFSES
jgi:hypothetical protein